MLDNPIKFQTKNYPEKEIFNELHPFVKEWFIKKFKHFSPPQRFSVLNIKHRINTLISSPTGSGKTLSAFLAIIDNLVTLADKGQLNDKIYAIYISPLKALANDIDKNLKQPLKEIEAIAKQQGRKLKIRVGTRTGDTTPSQKQGMLKKPPHILITTPESFAISLATKKFSEMLSQADYVIIDEVHALADNKRGTHLSLILEQLEDFRELPEPLIRIGLSATVRPLEEVANYLVGMNKGKPRPCNIVDVQFLKKLDLKVLSPVKDLINSTHNQMQNSLYNTLHDLIQGHRTTLVFTNTRGATERVVHQLRDRFPKDYTGILDAEKEEIESEDKINNGAILDETFETQITKEEKLSRKKGNIGAHHGSLSKSHRLRIENSLKEGKLKAVVCSTSLELGIDIGYVDLVVLLGSPKSVARALQRIGRSGHQLHEKAKGRIIVLNRDDLIECSVLLKAAIEKKIDRIHIPKNALDILSQVIYGLAIEKKRHIEEIFNLVTNAYPYANLKREDFDKVIDYLSGEHVVLEKRYVYGKIWYDRESGIIGPRGKLARLIYMTNIGTIPDQTSIRVKIKELTIGTITEDFLEKLKPGDVFVLGGEAYEFRFSRGLTANVKTSAGRPPTVPQWISEMLPLSFDLANEIQKFRKYLNEMFVSKKSKNDIKKYIDHYLYVDANANEAIYNYFKEQYSFMKIPHRTNLIVEHFKEGNKKYAIFHTLYGRRVNDVLSRAVAFALAKTSGRDVEIGINDNGFYLKSTRPIPAKRLLSLIKPKELERIMTEALEKSEVLRMRFRHCAARGMMILRNYKGRSKSVGKQQMSSRLIMNSVKNLDINFPILKEARREVLEDFMDVQHARELLEEISKDKIKVEEINTNLPSPFAFQLVLQGYTDLLKMEDRVAFIKRMHELVINEIEGKKTKFEAPEIEFTYDKLWDKQKELDKLKKEDEIAYLHELFRSASKKAKLEVDLRLDGHRFIDGDPASKRFDQFLDNLLQGTVPKLWPDDLIKFFINKR